MIVCFDIGGTAIKGGVASTVDDLRALPRRPTPTRDFGAFVDVLRAVIAEAGGRPERVSISIAGVVDPETGAAIVANIPCLAGRPLARDLEAALGVPVLISNDADCFALAEATVGAGVGHSVVFGAILGTGVGGGLVAGGRLLTTAGYSGEWGHGPVAARLLAAVPEVIPAFPCGCGLKGCLDATCSARGLERLHAFLGGGALTSPEILDRWEKGEAAAGRTVAACVEILGGPLAMVVNVTGASIVPVGGGLSNNAALLAEIDRATRKLTLRRFGRPLVVQAKCRTEPGLVGAAIRGLHA